MSGGTGGSAEGFFEYGAGGDGGVVGQDGTPGAGGAGSRGAFDEGTYAYSTGGGGGSAGGGTGGAGGGTTTGSGHPVVPVPPGYVPSTATGGAGGAGGQNGAPTTPVSTAVPSADIGPATGGNGESGSAGVESDGGAAGGGGGGEGGYGLILAIPTTTPEPGFSPGDDVDGALTGGNGGAGGVEGGGAAAGQGGGGGIGLDVLATGAVFNVFAAIQGGTGGASPTGIGGNGGAGASLADGDTIAVNSSVAGGRGGAGATDGAGGAGIVGSNLEIDLGGGGSISGGYAGGSTSGASQADAIDIVEGDGGLLMGGGTLSGGIGIEGIGTTFNIEYFGVTATLANAISGQGGLGFSTFDSFVSTIDLTGSNTYAGGTLIRFDTVVVVSKDGNLGAESGGLDIQGGTLEVSAGFASDRAVQIGEGSTVEVDNAGAVLALNGTLSDTGSDGSSLGVLKTGAGTLKLTADNTGFSIGTALDAGTLELGQASSGGSAAIDFGSGHETLRLDFAGILDAHVTDFAVGDRLDLTALSATATASYANGVLTLSDGTNSDKLGINAPPSGEQFTVSNDGLGYALVTLTPVSISANPTPTPTNPPSTPTPINPPSTPAPITSDTVEIDATVTYGRGVFSLTGGTSSAAGVKSVEISADVDGVTSDLGAATVNQGGTFSFSDRIGAHTQGHITATETDGAGGMTSSQAAYSLNGILSDGRAEQVSYTADGSSEAAVTRFGANGRSVTQVKASGQTVDLQPFEIVSNHHDASTTYVFSRGDELDVIDGFKVDGVGHNTLDLPSGDFKNLADVLRHTGDVNGSAFITDPKTGDAIRLAGVTTAELKAQPKDFSFGT